LDIVKTKQNKTNSKNTDNEIDGIFYINIEVRKENNNNSWLCFKNKWYFLV